MTRKELLNDLRFFYVGVITIPISLLIMGLIYLGLQFSDGVFNIRILTEGFLTLTFGGIMLFMPFIWIWGMFIGLLVWPVVWNAPPVRKLTQPKAAAVCAFVVAVLGGVVPFGALSYPNLNSFSGLFAIPAVIASIIGPLVAYRVYCQPPKARIAV